jgi:hypothetical protein
MERILLYAPGNIRRFPDNLEQTLEQQRKEERSQCDA